MGLLDLKRGAIANGLCGQYAEMWNNAQNKKDLVDIALDANGMRFLASTSAKNAWGLSPQYISEKFAEFINGKYLRKRDGYTSEIFVLFNGTIKTRSTALVIMQCDCDVYVPLNRIVEIYVSCGSKIRLHSEGVSSVLMFDEESEVENVDSGRVHIIKMAGWS